MREQQAELYGREREQLAIADLLAGARAGRSGMLVLRGEPGIGKTALLDAAAGAAGELKLLRGTGSEVEAELPFAGLHQLLRPALGCLPALPSPQRAALGSALGLDAGGGRDPMLVGLAVLSLLAEHSGETGALVLVDDAQWFDHASQDALLFAARRLHAEGVVLLFAARDGEGAFPAPGLPEHRLAGLSPEAAAAVLDDRDLAPALRYRLLAEAHGNPLALLELPAALAAEHAADLTAGALPLTDRLRLAFHGQVSRLPERTQAMLSVLSADETGAPAVVLRAAAELGADVDDLAPAQDAGLLRRGPDGALAFRHPLIRAAVYQRMPLGRQLAVHRALADALDAPEHADRRAWHRAAATTGPDEEVADALEHTAERARARSGHLAAAVAYQRAAQLSVDPPARLRRRVLAAQSALEAGDLARASELAGRAAGQSADPAVRAGLGQVLAVAEFWRGAFPAAHRMLVDAAELIADRDPEQAAAMLLQALHTGWYLGQPQLTEVLDRLGALRFPAGAPLRHAAGFAGRLLDLGPGEEAPPLAVVLAEIDAAGGISDQALAILGAAGLARGQDVDAYHLAVRQAARLRETGAAGRLPTILFFIAEIDIFCGRLHAARATVTEALRLAEDTGQQQWVRQFSSVFAHLEALAGDEEACRSAAAAGLAGDAPGAIAPGAPWAHWSLGLLELGQGRAESALSRFERLTRPPLRHHVCAVRSAPDLVEAAVRIAAPERAAPGFARFAAWAQAVRQPWADALVLRCRALLEDDAAEQLYPQALRVHDRDGRPLEYARTALLYGEWLRRARRKAEARAQLADALEVFERLGLPLWAQRARHELAATGVTDIASETKGSGPRSAIGGLTPQELQIVRLAARGQSNRDIAAQLFLSHRTVGYHLYKAYPKLGVTSRGELKDLTAHLES
jgi:DNA-binding CsgD family transcriptional regulator